VAGVTRHRILLVEDDPDERAGLAELLEIKGYEVTTVGSAEEALDLLQVDEFDLLISDYQLGGATGAWLARIAAHSMHVPASHALLITGRDHIVDGDGLTVLRKPLDLDQFLSEVAQALSAPVLPGREIAPPAQRIALILYVNDSVSSRRARRALETLLADYDAAQVALDVVDLSTDSPHQAEAHRIVVTPTLLKTFPAPRVWIGGQLDQSSAVKRLLEQAGVEARK
jgi:CheY-like chemotaxis protein